MSSVCCIQPSQEDFFSIHDLQVIYGMKYVLYKTKKPYGFFISTSSSSSFVINILDKRIKAYFVRFHLF